MKQQNLQTLQVLKSNQEIERQMVAERRVELELELEHIIVSVNPSADRQEPFTSDRAAIMSGQGH